MLGCVLLSPNDCMGECIEKLKAGAEVFYDLRHQTIYNALAEMYDKREAIDVITLHQRLKDKQLLEQVGGIGLSRVAARRGAVGGQSPAITWNRAGEISSAQNDPHLHGGCRPRL